MTMPTMTTTAAMPPKKRILPVEDFLFAFLAWVVLSLSSDPAAGFVDVDAPLRGALAWAPWGYPSSKLCRAWRCRSPVRDPGPSYLHGEGTTPT